MSDLADFSRRHIGPNEKEIQEMLRTLGFSNLDELTNHTVPAAIRLKRPLQLEKPLTEAELLQDIRALAANNDVYKSYIGQGYYDCLTPTVILRNIMENPGWYTQYTPYQAEISQGRLEALLNFQTMICDLTGMEIANASLLDEGTAAAEAMALALHLKNPKTKAKFFVSDKCFTQTIDVVKQRAEPLEIDVIVCAPEEFSFGDGTLGALVQYPDANGNIHNYKNLSETVHKAGGLLVVAADILGLTILTPPAEFGADIVVGNSQRFGVPMGFGGPHAAYFATKSDYKRLMPGRLVGVSVDKAGNRALRLALQTREQHIRRNKATSNICTAQVLLAVMASMYAVYHGPQRLKDMALRIHKLTKTLAQGLDKLGCSIMTKHFFDTIEVDLGIMEAVNIAKKAKAAKINFHHITQRRILFALDEATTLADLDTIFGLFVDGAPSVTAAALYQNITVDLPSWAQRQSAFLTHPVFNSYHTETEMLRYLTRLQNKDLSLTSSMIPLGSCTMKLNATTEMIPVTWPEFAKLHPFAPQEQTKGYREMFRRLEGQLAEITGFEAVSLQPNAGSQGEYAGLLVIRAFQKSSGQGHRNVCLIPTSAHGTNPASAVMAGLDVVPVECDDQGNISLKDLKEKANAHKDRLSSLMVTYPSTHGVFEEAIIEICDIVHQAGGQVYMDGANLNAQVGLCRPGDFGPDVCHLNLHKTFCIPHGGGGPGMGPIAVKKHLAPFLPGHPLVKVGGDKAIGAISAAPWGSSSILPISYAYIRMMGADGLKKASQVAILNANYIAKKLESHYKVLYKGREGLVAHECILDLRPFKVSAGIDFEDMAKRLMDYGFHAPTMSWPVGGTMMIEPTESENKAELDRFCNALMSIKAEIDEIATGKADRNDNLLKNAPHTSMEVCSDEWTHSYSRMKAAFPDYHTKQSKFWPSVGRIDNPYGDRNLVCTCPTMEDYSGENHSA